MDKEYITVKGPMDRMFNTLVSNLITRLNQIGYQVELTNDQHMMQYKAVVRCSTDEVEGNGVDWSPVAAIEKAYADHIRQ
jgi:hypothetical protein